MANISKSNCFGIMLVCATGPQVWEWLCNCIRHFTGYVINSMLGRKSVQLSNMCPWSPSDVTLTIKDGATPINISPGKVFYQLVTSNRVPIMHVLTVCVILRYIWISSLNGYSGWSVGHLKISVAVIKLIFWMVHGAPEKECNNN